MTKIEVYTGVGRKVPARIVFQDTRKFIKWGMEYIDELMSPKRWGEVWLTNGGGNRALVVNQEDFGRFMDGFLDRWNVKETEDSEFYLGKIKALREAIDGKEVVANG